MKISILIPAYNEANTIADIIKNASQNSKIDEILVIDDGSEDNTAEIVKSIGARVISLSENQGKGAAIQKGVENINSEIIIMLDGDLIGLKSKHIDILLKPLLYKNIDMSVGVFNEGRNLTDLAQLISPALSGQRAIKTAIIKDLKDLKDAGYGLEIALNSYVKKHGRYEFVNLPGLTHIMKEEKMGFFKGLLSRLKMYWEIVKTLLKKYL